MNNVPIQPPHKNERKFCHVHIIFNLQKLYINTHNITLIQIGDLLQTHQQTIFTRSHLKYHVVIMVDIFNWYILNYALYHRFYWWISHMFQLILANGINGRFDVSNMSTWVCLIFHSKVWFMYSLTQWCQWKIWS